MEKYTNYIELFLPKQDIDDQYLETEDDYCDRIKNLLPNFPKDILSQWLYEHCGDIEKFAWLDFTKLKFKKKLWGIEELIDFNIENYEIVKHYLEHIKRKTKTPRFDSLTSYIRKNGTWPTAPIFLENCTNQHFYPNGLACHVPIHPLEGHHRLAVLLSYKKEKFIKQKHEIWISQLIYKNKHLG